VKQGVERVVLGRELSLKEIGQVYIRQSRPDYKTVKVTYTTVNIRQSRPYNTVKAI